MCTRGLAKDGNALRVEVVFFRMLTQPPDSRLGVEQGIGKSIAEEFAVVDADGDVSIFSEASAVPVDAAAGAGEPGTAMDQDNGWARSGGGRCRLEQRELELVPLWLR